ncbi:hypothetical protein [Gordonia sp. DT101]|uniref:hypothetical protein n=1 Tax=Gordonia sp. DT101 TaxID=3416545 RepID=UPI003CE744B4
MTSLIMVATGVAMLGLCNVSLRPRARVGGIAVAVAIGVVEEIVRGRLPLTSATVGGAR